MKPLSILSTMSPKKCDFFLTIVYVKNKNTFFFRHTPSEYAGDCEDEIVGLHIHQIPCKKMVKSVQQGFSSWQRLGISVFADILKHALKNQYIQF